MDRTQTLGFVLIITILFTWMWMTAPKPQKQNIKNKTENQKIEKPEKEIAAIQTMPVKSELLKENKTTLQKSIFIETENFIAEISNYGGTFKKFELTNYKTWGKKHNVQLVNDSLGGDLDLRFISKDGKEISTKDYYFDFRDKTPTRIKLKNNEKYQVKLFLKTNQGEISKTLTFFGNKFTVELEIKIENVNSLVSNYEYQLEWNNGLKYTEMNSIAESQSTAAYAFTGGELLTVDAAAGESKNINPTGVTNWVATNNKYFAIALISEDNNTNGCYVSGKSQTEKDFGQTEKYSVALKIPTINSVNSVSKNKIYIGPMDLNELKDADKNLGNIINLGWSWIRPLSEFVFIPLFNILQFFSSNFGVVIILFTIILKAILLPLSRSSMKSMRKMKALQPKLVELKEKYKSDPNQLNMQTMKMYKEYGVNPAGGCLPLLLQMPILYGLYSLFTNSIELRQASFVLWINDLSIPDILFNLPFKVPLIGLQQISGLALLMAIAMFVQQKMTVQDPQQKAMVYIMPPMMFLLFNYFPAGLNLYYLVFNLLSLGEQIYYTKFTKQVELVKVERKQKNPSFFEKLMQRAQEQAERQKKRK